MGMLAGPNSVLRAMAFAHDAGARSLEAWMCWAGWRLFVGCTRCRTDGPDAPCWGWAGCHGHHNACGCQHCAERQAEELAA